MSGPISKSAFKAWLESKDPTVSVGMARRASCCPLATYLAHEYKTELTSVDHRDADVNGITYKMPHWAAQFIRYVDGRDFDSRVITAAEALSILEAIS